MKARKTLHGQQNPHTSGHILFGLAFLLFYSKVRVYRVATVSLCLMSLLWFLFLHHQDLGSSDLRKDVYIVVHIVRIGEIVFVRARLCGRSC